MSQRSVFLVVYEHKKKMTVSVDGETISMGEFLETHTPIQISAPTPLGVENKVEFIAFMIAEKNPVQEGMFFGRAGQG